MKVSRVQAIRNRRQVIATAARLFRAKGFDGVGVAELMQAAGLTHGGFYAQFRSKEELMALACQRALEASAEHWAAWIAEADSPEAAYAQLVRRYVSESHCRHPERGCVIPALGTEAARRGPQVRQAITEGSKALIALLAGLQGAAGRQRGRQQAGLQAGKVQNDGVQQEGGQEGPQGGPEGGPEQPAERETLAGAEQRAQAVFALLAGAVLLARCSDDEAYTQAILASATQVALELGP